jgi:excinuclease ABC subunit C
MVNYKTLPKDPGVYIFKNKEGKIIYIGKAKNLKKRVSSYFTKNTKSTKTQFLVKQIKSVDHIIVNNEIEALLLENKFIKQHTPKYNIMLKDGKTYAYLRISDEKYPKLSATRQIGKKGTYFGPYTDGTRRKELKRLVVQIFKLRVCQTLPKRACLNYHIGLCTAPCINKVTEKEYQGQVKQALQFLKGNNKETIRYLKAEMNKASKDQRYELALERKKQLEAIKILEESQHVDVHKEFDQDVIAITRSTEGATIVVFTIKKGVISGKKEYKFDDMLITLLEFIPLYYSERSVPKEVIVNEKCWDKETSKDTLEAYLTKIRGTKVIVILPQRGEKKALAELAIKNAKEVHENEVLIDIQDKLNLPTLPRKIECFDISNLGDQHIVGAMTQWIDGKPNKDGYRKFRINWTKTQDDFMAMYEVIYRRYKRVREEDDYFPDLIIIDGGKGQLGVALKALKVLGLKIPIIGLAKKQELIYIPQEDMPLDFENNSKMMLLIRNIRNSVHKYVLGYNRSKRRIKK